MDLKNLVAEVNYPSREGHGKANLTFTEMRIIHILRQRKAANSEDPLYLLLSSLSDSLKSALPCFRNEAKVFSSVQNHEKDSKPLQPLPKEAGAKDHLYEYCWQLLLEFSTEQIDMPNLQRFEGRQKL